MLCDPLFFLKKANSHSFQKTQTSCQACQKSVHSELPLNPITESVTNTWAGTNTTQRTVGAVSRVRGQYKAESL